MLRPKFKERILQLGSRRLSGAPSAKAAADRENAIGNPANSHGDKKVADVLRTGQDVSNPITELKKNKDLEDLPEGIQEAKQTDTSPRLEVLHNDPVEPNFPAEETPSLQLETAKDRPAGPRVLGALAAGSELPAEDRPRSQLWTPEERAAELWATAYDWLREKNPELVQGYAITIRKWLVSNNTYLETQRLRPLAMDLPLEEGLARTPFDLVAGVMLKELEPEPESESKSESESDFEQAPESGHDRTNYIVKKRSIKSDGARSLSKLLQKALRAFPHASIAWAAAYVTLQNLLRPVPRTEAMQSQILSVISKTEWFIELFRLFFWPDQTELPMASESSPVNTLITLYESVLAYHMHVAVEFDIQRTLQQPKLVESLLRVPLDELQACELLLVSTFDRLRVQKRLVEQLDHTRMDNSNTLADDKLRKILARLNVDQQRVHNLDTNKSYILDRLYGWASTTPEFQKFTTWDDEGHSRLLCVNAPPGAGKSMLLQAAVRSLPMVATSSPNSVKHVAYFFCDGTLWRQGNILSILKALISGVLLNQPDLGDHLELIIDKRRNLEAEEDVYALSPIFYSMIQDSRFAPTYFVLDGIEQFTTHHGPVIDRAVDVMVDGPARKLSDLQLLIARTVRLSRKVKWLLGVECELHEDKLTFVEGHQGMNLTLDESKYHVLPEIVQEYAAFEVANTCKRLGYNDNIRKRLTEHLKQVKGNFLFTSMALDIVGASTSPWNAIYALHKLAADKLSIHELYDWNYCSIDKLPYKDPVYCRNILYAAAAVYRPLPISELVAIIELPPEVDPFLIIEKLLPTFLEIREGQVCFKHLSASTFIRDKMGKQRLRSEHSKIAQQCLKLLLRRLDCSHNKTDPDGKIPETKYELTMIIWVKHLSEIGDDDPLAVALAVHLLSIHLIEWLELLDAKGLIFDVLYMLNELNTTFKLNVPHSNPFADLFVHVQKLEVLDDEAKKITQLVREVITFIASYQRWKAHRKEERQPEDDSTYMSPGQWLLFAADLPFLREKLLPVIFPRLQHAPVLDRTDDLEECVRVLKHSDWVRGCFFSPNGRTLASVSDDTDVHVWDVRTGNLQQNLRGFDRLARGVVISSATTQEGNESGDVIAAFDRSRINLWDAMTGNLLHTLNRGEREEINQPLLSIALSPAADMLAAAVGASVVIWQLPDTTSYKVLSGDKGRAVRRVTFSPDGKLLASTAGLEIIIRGTLPGVGDTVCILPSSQLPEESQTLNKGNSPRESQPAAAQENINKEREQSGHTEVIDGLCFSPDSKFLVSGSDDRTARVWDVDKQQTVAILKYHRRCINDVCFSSDGSWIATGSSDSTIALWKHKSPGNWGSGESRKQPDHILRGHDEDIFSVSFSPLSGGNLLASASRDEELRIWDLDKISKMIGSEPSTGVSTSKGHDSGVTCVAISQDNCAIASVSYDGVICCWDGKTGARQHRSEESHDGEVLSMNFSPDGQLLVTASVDRTAFVWEVAGSPTTSLMPRLRLKHDDWVPSAQFDPQGRLVATVGDEGIVRVYDVSGARTTATTTIDAICNQPSTTTQKEMKILRSHRGHSSYLYGVAFSPDSKRLASGGDDQHLMIWGLGLESEEDTPLHDMKSENLDSRILDVEFSVDGTRVVSLSADGTIAVWRPSATPGNQCQIIQKGEASGRGAFMSIRIDPQFPELLLTELGAKYVNMNGRLGDKAGGEPSNSWRPPTWLPLSVDKSGASISYNSGKEGIGSSDDNTMIYLPPNLNPTNEPYSCRVQGNLVVIGCVSGHVLVFQFTAGE